MSPIERDEIKSAVKDAVNEVIGPLYVDRETHYKHHQFIDDLIKWMDETKGTVRKTIVHAVVWGLLALLVLGFVVYVNRSV